MEPDFTNSAAGANTVRTLRSSYTPGDLGFDPLKLLPKNPTQRSRMMEKELNNGRARTPLSKAKGRRAVPSPRRRARSACARLGSLTAAAWRRPANALLTHARLAALLAGLSMIGVAGFVGQELATGQPIFA